MKTKARPLAVFPHISEQRNGVKIGTTKCIPAVDARSDQARITSVEHRGRKAMRTLNRKQSSSSNVRPCSGVFDKLPVQKQAVLVVPKICKSRSFSVSFGPESQYRVPRPC